MKKLSSIFVGGLATAFLSLSVSAKTIPVTLSISNSDFKVVEAFSLSDVGEGKTSLNFDFKDNTGVSYSFDLKYKKLPSNRSYPTNLDVTIKNAEGKKLAYLFLANNGVEGLQKQGVWGVMFDVNGQPMNVHFDFGKNKTGTLSVDDLGNERFVQDTLVSKFGFQMIRPVILPMTTNGVRSVTYSLDAHPYSINYTLKDKGNGVVEFQHNLYGLVEGVDRLLERIYFEANSLESLREAMYAGKYFDPKNGTFKLVFYPTLGQTTPPKR
jgi:hypothetical protein